jgi:hypothetical protein
VISQPERRKGYGSPPCLSFCLCLNHPTVMTQVWMRMGGEPRKTEPTRIMIRASPRLFQRRNCVHTENFLGDLVRCNTPSRARLDALSMLEVASTIALQSARFR